MTLPRDEQPAEPAPVHGSEAAPLDGSTTLGTVALWLGTATAACGLLQVVFTLIIPPNGPLSAIPMLGIPLGIAAVVVAIVAIAKDRGRRHGIIGLVLAAAAGPVAWLIGFLYIVVMLVLHYGV